MKSLSNQTAHFLVMTDLGSPMRLHTSPSPFWSHRFRQALIWCHSAGYIGDFDIIDDHRSGKIVVQLNGRLNKTGVISPRFNVQVNQIENWVNLLLPARSFGKLILVSAPVEIYSSQC
jgi:ribosomal protein S8